MPKTGAPRWVRPLVDFGAISTRDQLARLERGRVGPDQFDWAALAFDFGPSGRAALTRLAAAAARYDPVGATERAVQRVLGRAGPAAGGPTGP